MARNQGLHTYSGEEGMNASLGQTGFKVLTGSDNTGDGNFIAFQVVGNATTGKANVAATVHTGDAISAFDIDQGTIVYGPFKRITVGTATTCIVLCYYG